MLVYSSDEENFIDDLNVVIDDIISYNCETIEEAKEAILYVGEAVYPKIDATWVLENMQEYVTDCLYETCGEYADRFNPNQEYDEELLKHIDVWLSKQNYGCYTVKNVKEESIMNHITEEELSEFYNV